VTKTKLWVAALAIAGLGTVGRGAAAEVDEKLPAYQVVSGVSGNLASVGSDTMNELMEFLGATMKKNYPSVIPTVDGKGSSNAPPALIEGTSQFGPMSREMKAEEIDKFEKKFGYKPLGVVVALDALAVYVHKDNPIASFTLQQVDAIFSSTRKSGAPADVTTWGQLGLTGPWASLPISLYGRDSASGTNGYFKEVVLAKGDYKATVKEQKGSAAVVKAVAADRGGIGYSGIGYRTSDVRAVPIVAKDGKPYEPNEANVYSGKYSISRGLYVYVNKAPGRPLQAAVREFLLLALSKDGQTMIEKKAGFVPLTAPMAAKERAKVLDTPVTGQGILGR
jgi:phosphate transport system substrate-binding protein